MNTNSASLKVKQVAGEVWGNTYFKKAIDRIYAFT